MQSDWRGFMKVVFIYKSGRKRLMARHYADILKTLGHGDYQKPDVVAVSAPVTDVPPPEGKGEAGGQGSPAGTQSGETLGLGFENENQNSADADNPQVIDLNTLNRDQLLELAKDRDVKIHGNASDEKIRDALMASASQSET